MLDLFNHFLCEECMTTAISSQNLDPNFSEDYSALDESDPSFAYFTADMADKIEEALYSKIERSASRRYREKTKRKGMQNAIQARVVNLIAERNFANEEKKRN